MIKKLTYLIPLSLMAGSPPMEKELNVEVYETSTAGNKSKPSTEFRSNRTATSIKLNPQEIAKSFTLSLLNEKVRNILINPKVIQSIAIPTTTTP